MKPGDLVYYSFRWGWHLSVALPILDDNEHQSFVVGPALCLVISPADQNYPVLLSASGALFKGPLSCIDSTTQDRSDA